MYKQDLALNNSQRLICHKTLPTNLIFPDMAAQSAWAVEYITASLQMSKSSPPTSVLDMTLNNQMARF